MRTFLALFVLAVSSLHAQAIRYDWISSTTNSSCVSGALCPILAIPGTTVNVCQGTPANLTGCLASLATTYTNAGAGTACATTSQLTPATGGACLSTSDNQGNFGWWILPGSYSYFLTIPRTAGGGSYGPYPINLGASAGCPLGATCDANYATLPLACTAAGVGTLYVTRSWNSQATETLACQLFFLGNGKIQAASSQTITINPSFTCGTYRQCFDQSASGSAIAFTGNLTQPLNPIWYGADPTGAIDSAAAINAALNAVSAGTSILLQPGNYKLTSGTVSLTAGSSLSGVPGTPAPVTINSTGAFTAITVANAANVSLSNFRLNSAQDGILISETGATCNSVISTCAQYDRLQNVTVASWGSTYAGIHVTSTTCCVYNPIFENVNLLGPVAAPNVSTRSNYLFDGTSGFTLFTNIKNGRITNGFKGLNLLNFQQGRIEDVEIDGITNDMTGMGAGTAVALNCGAGCGYNDFKLIYEGLGSGGNIDINASFDAASYSNWLTSIGFVAANTSRLVDNGTLNCLWGAGGGGAVPDYCLAPRSFGNVTIPSGYVLSMPGVTNGQFLMNGGQTSDQLSGVGCLICIKAPNTNFGYPIAMMADASGRGISMVTQGFSAAGTTGTTMLLSPSAGIVYAGTGGTIGLPLPFNSGISIDQSGSGVFFASLGAPANGTIRYCKNCKNVIDDSVAAGAACVTAGSGAVARRENGHWACN